MRAEFQILVIPFIREINGRTKFVVFKRSDDGNWQFIAGSGDEGELPLETAKREAKEEAGLESEKYYRLKTVSMIPIDVFREHRNKKSLYVIPEHCFAVETEHENITISKEHTEYKILNYEEAFRLLKYDGNKTALWELNEKLKSGKLSSQIKYIVNNYAFIDSQNLNLAIRDLNWTLDFTKFRIYLKDKYHVTKAFLFIGYIPSNQNLYTKLQNDGYTLVFKNTLTLPSGKPKGNVDAELVLQTIIEIENYDKAVIVSGDGDFYCLVDYLIRKNKLEKLLIPDRASYSTLFKKLQKYISFVSDLKEKLGYK